jgi:hypothetical protein
MYWRRGRPLVSALIGGTIVFYEERGLGMSALVDTNTTPGGGPAPVRGSSPGRSSSPGEFWPLLALSLSLGVREESTGVHLTFHGFIEVTGPGLRSGEGVGLANAYTLYRYVGLAKTFAL